MMSERQLQRQDLGELHFLFRSVSLFLEHLDLRLQRLLPQLEHLQANWSRHEAQRQSLGQELDSTGQEVLFLRRELGTLERILAGQESTRQRRQQETAQDLRQLFQHLEDELEQTRQRLEDFESLAQDWQARLLEYAQAQAQLQAQNQHLNEAIQGFEESEQAYLGLLEQKNQQIAELKQLYDFELEQMVQELQDSSQEQQNRQSQSQSIGKSLARLAQERNAMVQEQEHLQEQIQSLEQANQALQQDLQQAQEQARFQQNDETFWQQSSQTLPLNAIVYSSFYETLQALGLSLPHTVLQAAAEALQLAPQQQQHLQSRVRLQPGRLSQVLAAHPHQLELPAPQPPEPLAYFVQVPAGPYPIGDELQPAERPAQLWHSPGYAIARFPVTNADFEQFMQAGGYQQPDYWLPEGWTFVQQEGMQTPAFWCKRGYQSGPDYPDYPVVGVSWYEALAYTTWRQCRLPTELEWEAAGRGPEGLRWPWGNSWDAERANTADNQLMNTTPVGLYPAGASPLGCMDLIGNVFEWTLSVYQAYPYQAEDGREDLRSPAPRTLRGCSWNHRGSYFTRLSYRFQAEPETRHSDIGFRCAQAGPLI